MSTLKDIAWVGGHRSPPESERPSAVLTIRMTPEQHQRLKDRAWRSHVSLNVLANTALVMLVEQLEAEEVERLKSAATR